MRTARNQMLLRKTHPEFESVMEHVRRRGPLASAQSGFVKFIEGNIESIDLPHKRIVLKVLGEPNEQQKTAIDVLKDAGFSVEINK